MEGIEFTLTIVIPKTIQSILNLNIEQYYS